MPDLVWLYSNLRLAKRTQSLEEQEKAKPWVLLSGEEEEEEEEGSSTGGYCSDEDVSRAQQGEWWTALNDVNSVCGVTRSSKKEQESVL